MSFITFNENTGLEVKTKVNILQDLKAMFKTAYGQDFEIVEGTEMYAFIDLLSQELAQIGSAAKSVYDAYGFTSATGTALDAACSISGISRRQGESDNALRARYFSFLYSKTVGTVEGIKARLLDHTFVDTATNTTQNSVKSVHLINNNTAQEKSFITNFNIPPHSIAVVCRYTSVLEEQDDLTKSVIRNELSQIVQQYTSLGCGILLDPYGYTYYEAQPESVHVEIKLTKSSNSSLSTEEENAFKHQLSINLTDYINNLDIGKDLLYIGVTKCVYDTYVQLNLPFDECFGISQISINDQNISIKYNVEANNYLVLSELDVTIQEE